MLQKKEIINTYQKKNIAETFDGKRSKYAHQRYKHKIESNFLKKTILDIFSKNIKILDVACGTGRMLPEVFSVRKDIKYYGVDSSKEMTNLLKEKAKKIGVEKRIKIKISDASKLPFKDNEFNLVYSFHLLWHIPKENQEKIIKEMFRVTKKNGIIIFDILNKNFIYEKIKKFLKIKKTEGIYKLSFLEVNKIILNTTYKIEKLSDFPIKNRFLYSIFNLENKFRKILPTNFFHMIYFKIKK